MAARLPNLVPRWGKVGAKMTQDGACLAILAPIGELSLAFWRSWERSLQKWPKYKIEHRYGVLATFSGLGGSGWRLFGAILKLFGHMLGYLGRSWPQVGTFLAGYWEKDGEDEPR